jgi:hypothetical protein
LETVLTTEPAMGTIETTCAVMASLLRGHTYDRHSLARDFGMTVASADRYLRNLALVPGVVALRKGRRLLVSFSFGDALKEIGR